MIQMAINAFLIASGLLVVTTLVVFVVFALGTLSDKFIRKQRYWPSVIGATLEYLSVASIFWGIATAICLLFFTIGFASALAGVIL